jgi:hypothetical protein
MKLEIQTITEKILAKHKNRPYSRFLSEALYAALYGLGA